MKLIYNPLKLTTTFSKSISFFFLFFLITQTGLANAYSGGVGRFAATANNCQVKVIWNTESEDGIKLFEIEWSGDGQTFQKIATQFATGASPSNAEYIFQDENASFSNYYRLKIVKLDGSYNYTKVVLAKKECKINNTLNVFPNPALLNSSILNLEFIPTKPQSQILINDMLGRTIQRINYEVEVGVVNKFELDISNYPAGNYNMIVVGEQQAKIFVIK